MPYRRNRHLYQVLPGRMLFNSFIFLFAYLPVVLGGFFWLGRRNHTWASGWLAFASLFFYGYWDYRYVPLLLASIGFNYWGGLHISQATSPSRKRWLALAIAANLSLLAYFKYANFFLDTASFISNEDFSTLDIILPIGISFYTFTQIAFLVDTYQDKVREYRFVHYLLFVTYFPHLIAGPVLHHKEMMPQFADGRMYRLSATNFAVGVTIFSIGLAKKVLIADNLSPYASPLFESTNSPSLFIAWGGVLAYSFQLYFDFSAYSDMAIGLSRLFGVRLPLNFNSPYKAENISEFWRRWHMTLSRFLRDYLYFPLGGNRSGLFNRYRNLMSVMLLGGMWHGAGWNFIIWGGLHGCYLVIHHAWAVISKRLGFPSESAIWKFTATVATFIAVCFAWVFFRSPDLATSWEIVRGMTGAFGIGLPDAIGNRVEILVPALQNLGVNFYLGGGSHFVETWGWIAFAAAIAFLLPNTQELVHRFEPALDFKPTAQTPRGGMAYRLAWMPSRLWAVFLGSLTVISLLSLNRPNEFLYFQF
ncbi:MBOAT family protein [Nitrosovibrio sp. Nv6]|uniref:MBOAT family O-acyltransferase n=1 Tax=Nitrosovibrio sp. Nv6 TaxID=1855340 RepID=UPI0008C43C8F|nr:MBOAT family protein [Nitrosovibrio sp. Nv6]SEP36032.1 D-alanyl-lipoteichoic acid acyltransferase DltB, MBOAT superfamily [Nitrosovibrio sp. Nv6]